jgi:tetratricopeptide (TPR) repeat protein
VRQGELPAPPVHGFVGRAKALLTIDRMLRDRRWVAITGGGGLGKTELAKEAARWRLAMRRAERIAFVSVEAIGDARGVLDAIGRQLVPGYAVSLAEGTGSDAEKRAKALLPVKGELARRKVLIVVDNLESVLPRPGEAIEAWTADILGMIHELCAVGETRVILTSREAAPAPLEGNIVILPALGAREATAMIAGVLKAKGCSPLKVEEDKEAIEKLVVAVGGHARSLVLLGELVAEKGVKVVAENVSGMMAELETRYPDQRERSLIASVKLSLRRLPEEARQKIRGFAVFHGAAFPSAIAHVLQVELTEALDLSNKLVAVGLAGKDGLYLLPDPALGATLVGELSEGERQTAEARWLEATCGLVAFLDEQQLQDAKIASHGVRIAITELMAALAKLQQEVDAGRTDAAEAMSYVTSLESLVSSVGNQRALQHIVQARQEISEHLLDWSHARFAADYEAVERQRERGDRSGTLTAARALLDLADAADNLFPEAAYNRATARRSLGRTLSETGHEQEAISVLRGAQMRFAELAERGHPRAARMESMSIAEIGNALHRAGKLDEAVAAYEDVALRARELKDLRSLATMSAQIGTVRFRQGRLNDALTAHHEALVNFQTLGVPVCVAAAWHQIGMVHAQTQNFEASESAYKKSLSISATMGDLSNESSTLVQLGSMYMAQHRPEEAAGLYRQAADNFRALNNSHHESFSLNNLGLALERLGRLNEARDAFIAALDLGRRYGHTAHPWLAWASLERVERETDHPESAHEARRKALETYRVYRTDGGEPANALTQLVASFGHTLRVSGPKAALTLLPDITEVPAQLGPIIRALRAIATGSRDYSLADDPAHTPTVVVELALLLESLLPADAASLPAVSLNDLCPCSSGAPFPHCHGATDPSAT